MAKKRLFLLTLLQLCSTQSPDFSIPNILIAVSKHAADKVTSSSTVARTTRTTRTTSSYTNTLTDAVTPVNWMPQGIARALGPVSSHIYSVTNKGIDLVQFVKDYREASKNMDAILDIDELIPKYGFRVEIHAVTTKDFYKLTMYRIPGDGRAVFLMHGLLGSADDFVVAGRDSGLAYLLADAGYDVWLGNARGNKHSLSHSTFKPSEAKFWDFSFHEIGLYDLPAMIDYVLHKTNKTTLTYIGHSQGTTAFFVMASEKPEYNQKIHLMIALSPVVFMENVRSPIIRLMSPGTLLTDGFSKSLGQYEFLPDNNFIKVMKLLLCEAGPIAEIVCSNALFLVAGFDYQQLNISNLPVILGHVPSGASIKQFAHYGQGVLSDDFRQFDYGFDANLKRYGVGVPPSYELESVIAPVALFYSESDWLAHPKDVERLLQSLSSVVDMYKVPLQQFNHLDFFMARDVKNLVNNRVLKVMMAL
uniref:AB hydrolase-1 domain-containing protein n=1 Tax=Heliothis virescens TaxID=7102 RepID=A0A2A4JCC5_HELVI